MLRKFGALTSMMCTPCDGPVLAAASPRTITTPTEDPRVDDDDDDVCRICFDGSEEEALISPCACAGAQRFVHLSCLQRWQRSVMNQARRRLVVAKKDETAHERCGRCRATFDREAVPALPKSRLRCCPAVRRGARTCVCTHAFSLSRSLTRLVLLATGRRRRVHTRVRASSAGGRGPKARAQVSLSINMR